MAHYVSLAGATRIDFSDAEGSVITADEAVEIIPGEAVITAGETKKAGAPLAILAMGAVAAFLPLRK